MKITKETQRTARRLFRLCFENGRLSEQAFSVLRETLGRERPKGYVALLTALKRLVEIEEAKYRVVITTARETEEPERVEIETKLHKSHPGISPAEWIIDPSLIAGMIIRIGDRVVDGSVKTRLEKISRLG